MNKRAAVIVFCTLLMAGCDYVPQQEFEVMTVDGKAIKFLCPVVDEHRNMSTYVIDHECRIIEVK